MKLAEFEESVRTGFPAAEAPDSLSGRIDTLLADCHKPSRLRIRPIYAVAASLLIAGFIAFPAVKAEAQLRRLAGALDDVTSVRILRFDRLDDGTEHPKGMVAYDQGKWRLDGGDRRITIFQSGVRWTFDPASGYYLMDLNADGPATHNPTGLKLADLMKDMAKWSGGNKPRLEGETLLNGKVVLKATIDGKPFPSRSVIYADPESSLPIEMHSESLEKSVWKVKSIQRFEYDVKLDAKLFEPDPGYPQVNRVEWAKRLVDRLTSPQLASTPLVNGRLVLRSVSVSEDGTIFVIYQAGEKTPRWDRGYAFEVSDDLGTTYCKTEVRSNLDEESIRQSKDGKIELEVFVPMSPSPWQPRTISLNAFLTSGKTILRAGPAYWLPNDGLNLTKWIRDPDRKVNPINVWEAKFAKPTCAEFPIQAGALDTLQYGSAEDAKMSKARARAWASLDSQDWLAAEKWMKVQERLFTENPSISRGFGSIDNLRKGLDTLRSRNRRP